MNEEKILVGKCVVAFVLIFITSTTLGSLIGTGVMNMLYPKDEE